MNETIILVTGGFDPIHSGHIAYFKDAKKLGNKLVVGVNSDNWLIKKKGSAFLPIQERIEIISNLSVVDATIEFEDDEYQSASNAIQKVLEIYPDDKIKSTNECKMLLQVHDELIFEIKKDKLEIFRKLIVAEMENALKPKFDLSVPLSVDSNNADNWSDAH